MVTAAAKSNSTASGRFFNARKPGGAMSHDTESEHLDVHVAVCAERYRSLEMRLDRIERVMWWMLSTLILALGGMVFQMFILFSGRLS
jgi:hypothetical protein